MLCEFEHYVQRVGQWNCCRSCNRPLGLFTHRPVCARDTDLMKELSFPVHACVVTHNFCYSYPTCQEMAGRVPFT
jgi:hypothetical protein